MSLDLVYAAALALLIRQVRDGEPMRDILASVARLRTLARVGSVTIRVSALDTGRDDSVGVACRLMRDIMRGHGLDAIDIATTATDTEFLKLAGLLGASPSGSPAALLQTAEAMSVWNVRLRAPGRASPASAGTPVTSATTAPQAAAPHVATPQATAPHVATPKVAAPGVVPPATPSAADRAAPVDPAFLQRAAKVEPGLAKAVASGDGGAVAAILRSIDDDALLQHVVTPVALQLLVEQFIEGTLSHDDAHTLLVRAGVAGTRAVFDQLVGATETFDRRALYDLAAGLPTVGDVAREHVHDERWYVVRNAAGLLGESGASWAITELGALLRHADARVRIAAVVSLGQIGGPVALARLESVLFDASIEVRNRALAIVFASPDHDPLPDRVLMALEEENALDYRLEMIAALAHVRTPRARARLEAIAGKPSDTIDDHRARLAAITALAEGHRPQADALLASLADDPNAEVRERARLG